MDEHSLDQPACLEVRLTCPAAAVLSAKIAAAACSICKPESTDQRKMVFAARAIGRSRMRHSRSQFRCRSIDALIIVSKVEGLSPSLLFFGLRTVSKAGGPVVVTQSRTDDKS